MRRLGLVLLAATTAACTFSINSQAQSVSTHHVREAIKNGQAQANGHLPGNQVLGLNIVLQLRDPDGLKAFLADIYNPASPNFHHFVTPAEFTARFGPTQAQYNAVVNFANTNGLTVTGGSRDGMNVQVSGTVSNIESAFHINMRTYKHPHENRNFYGPDTEPTTGLSFNIWHISGLDNYSIPHPLVENIHDYAAAHNLDVNGVVSHATTGSGPSASFLGSDMRGAYYNGGSLDGSGQNLGLWEYLGANLQDLNTYYSNVGQTNTVPITLLSVDGTSTSCSYNVNHCDDTEQTLDMTQALGMAPKLASLTMYIGSYDTTIAAALTTHSPLPTTIGCSWGWTPADPNTLDPYFQKMAAQGQSFFAASGDYSTWTKTGNSAAWPADDAYVISVGGTDLVTASAGGAWQSETAWADSGGGISPDSITIPSWQQLAGVINTSNNGSNTWRNGPDVSANANFTFYTCANQQGCLANTYGGTSFAAPMWAGYVALANQQLQTNGQSPAGFINPAIYNQNVNASTYAADFHDITSGTSGSYSAVNGYDLVTGWGSPNSGLMAALTGGSTSPSPTFSIGASSSSASVVQGSNNSGTTISVTPSNGFSSNVSLSASGLPSGVSASFSPNPIAGGSGTSTLTFTATSTAATGTYTVTITGTGGGVTQSTTVQLTVTAAQQTGSFTLSAQPSSLSVSRNSSNSTIITSSPVNGFNSSVTLSASGTGGGVTVSFSPNPIAANGSSTMTVRASRNAPLGTRTVTVTGASGTVTSSVRVTITITH